VSNRRAVDAMLERIQSIAVADLPPRNYVDYCTAYIKQLNQSLIEPALIKKILSAAAAIDNSVWPAVICHHDLVPENIIVTANGLVFLDWEYAAMGHPALDYLRLYQSDPESTNLSAINLPYNKETLMQLRVVLCGMDDLWTLVQD
jgi:thiamine kinase-like enzyme